MLCLSGFELYSRWVPLVVFLVHTHAKEALEWNVLTFLQMIYCS